ncbi:MAG: alpha/beta hydrolase [Pseudomonadota bacterium]
MNPALAAGAPAPQPGAQFPRGSAWAMLVCLLLLAGCAPTRGYESLLALIDAGAGDGPSRLKTVTASPARTPVSYVIAGRLHRGDLYLPGTGAPEAAIVLVPGAVPGGKDDPRLAAFAATLARVRFAVLVPDLPGFRDLRIQPTDARVVADAFAYLASRPELAPGGRAGIGAFSYAVGPAVLAALEEDIRDRVRFVLGVGGYHDLARAVSYFTTGWFEHEGRWHYLKPDDYGRMVFAKSSLPHLPPRDRVIVEQMVAIKLKDVAADISRLAPGLGPEGRAVYALLTNTDPGRVPQLTAALPPGLRADIAALSLHNKDIGRLRARLILVHGENDNLIPYPESIALAAAAPPGQARLFIIRRILGHVDLSPSPILSREFLGRELPDAWRMWRAVDALLAERQAEIGA